MQFDIEAFIVLLNTIIIAILTYYTRKRANGAEKAAFDAGARREDKETPDTTQLWLQMNEMEATLNKVLIATNKQIRGHGRTIQAGGGVDFAGAKPGLIKKTGVIV